MKEPKAGDQAPGFTLPSTSGGNVTLQDFAGKKRVVLYFYPKDDTSGCTKEACSFRDSLPKISAANTAVFGVSADSIESHQKFIDKYQLNFPLLSDPDHKVAEAYGAWGEKSLYGKKYFGIIRKTFIIGRDGRLEHVFNKVSPEGHGEEILALLK